MNKVAYRKTTWSTIVEWFQISIVVSLIGGCVYWLDQDDKRMYKQFMKECEAQNKPDQPRTNVDCSAAFRKAYRETFGR